jgi:hypothetical protein
LVSRGVSFTKGSYCRTNILAFSLRYYQLSSQNHRASLKIYYDLVAERGYDQWHSSCRICRWATCRLWRPFSTGGLSKTEGRRKDAADGSRKLQPPAPEKRLPLFAELSKKDLGACSRRNSTTPRRTLAEILAP